MRKIPTIFKRHSRENRYKLIDEPHPDCLWVFKGEGIATRKYDGTCCLIEDGKLYKRREVKNGNAAPSNFGEADYDPRTGIRVGWVPVDFDSKEDKWHAQAFQEGLSDGTYELLGPKIQGNPEQFKVHLLLKHSNAEVFDSMSRHFDVLKAWFLGIDIEGLVFHHPDGRMGKIKKKDFGLKRKD